MGTLITQKLKEEYTEAGDMRVWFGKESVLTNRLEEEDWIFVEAPSAYAAVKVVSPPLQDIKPYTWEKAKDFQEHHQWTHRSTRGCRSFR